ncbi:MAG: hypothetical protein CMN87_12300 [Stappia sp.]|uniref:hypothetical protein n=1 Tax=Stappia sp. TaxID=1870903 RepID=UPI000C3686B2|nr:hypothetical protein [Stappia sp.]MAB00144.1 hypothetical protein [Stappia sp.]MBM20783.1 hypothetical protein [Stappia sp.]|tara:strand:- start:487 stop:771 length:285 start_codon:yes stop_codon:yes gene_type:complete
MVTGTSDPRAERLVEDFDCVICRRHISNRWPQHAPTMSLKPVCQMCETDYGRRCGTAGTIRDRRILRQLSAVAEALNCAAHIADYHARNGGMSR